MATEAAQATLDHFWGILKATGNPVALIGGMSLSAWNHIRATRDVDLLIAVDLSNTDELVELLLSNGCRSKKANPIAKVGAYHFVQFLYTPPDEFLDVQIDLMLAESQLHKSALARRVTKSLEGMRFPVEVLSCEDLILLKLSSGRVIDIVDTAMLLRENHADLDQGYLQTWLKKLKVEAQYATCLAEAFPPDTPLQ